MKLININPPAYLGLAIVGMLMLHFLLPLARVVLAGTADERECQRELVIAPRSRVAQFVRDLLPCELRGEGRNGSTPPDTGYVTIRSDAPIAVGAIEMILPEGRMTSLPVAAVAG